MDSECSVGY